MHKRILRWHGDTGLKSKRGVSKSKHYCDISKGLWTRPVKLGPRASGWPEDESDELIAASIAEKSDAEIRALVQRLHAARKAAA